MDVTVSHLNNRLALQLPTELPLGLVFVVGAVEELTQAKNGRSSQVRFALAEQAYRVNCILSPRAANEVALREGMTIRAGGHLAFDPQWAGYYLLVRDVEIVQTPVAEEAVLPATEPMPEDRTAVAAILADIKRRSDAAHLAQADLPPWVQKIAPPEVQAEMLEEQPHVPEAPPPVSKPLSATKPALDTDLLARLSAAMDSDEDVELTSDMLVDFAGEGEVPSLPEAARPYDVPPPQAETAVPRPAVGWEDPEAITPPARRGTDYLMMLLIFAFVLVAVVLIIAIILTF